MNKYNVITESDKCKIYVQYVHKQNNDTKDGHGQCTLGLGVGGNRYLLQ